MSENNNNEKNSKTTYIIRAILCVVSLMFIVLSWLNIIPDTVGIVISALVLAAVSAWNGTDSIKEKKKGPAILKFGMSGILVIMCLIVLIF